MSAGQTYGTIVGTRTRNQSCCYKTCGVKVTLVPHFSPTNNICVSRAFTKNFGWTKSSLVAGLLV